MFNVINSTSSSIEGYQYLSDEKNLKAGKTILLKNKQTKEIKKFKIEYIKKKGEEIILKNANITVVLKRSI